MLRWFRDQKPRIAAVTLSTYFTALPPMSLAWARAAETYEANSSSSATGEYAPDSLESLLSTQSTASVTASSNSPSQPTQTPSSGTTPAVSVPAGAGVQGTQSVSPQAI